MVSTILTVMWHGGIMNLIVPNVFIHFDGSINWDQAISMYLWKADNSEFSLFMKPIPMVCELWVWKSKWYVNSEYEVWIIEINVLINSFPCGLQGVYLFNLYPRFYWFNLSTYYTYLYFLILLEKKHRIICSPISCV